MKRLMMTAAAIALLTTTANACDPDMAFPRIVNEAVVNKLCPDKSAPCKARDNPDFYKDSDWDFYMRITKQDPRTKHLRC